MIINKVKFFRKKYEKVIYLKVGCVLLYNFRAIDGKVMWFWGSGPHFFYKVRHSIYLGRAKMLQTQTL